MNAIQKLRQMVDQIRDGAKPLQVQKDWELVGRLIGRMPVDQDEATRAVREQDIDALDALVYRLEHPDAEPAPAPPAVDVSDDDKRAAMKAFRKRLKFARLSDESRITGRRLTKGRKSDIDAIIPPTDFSQDVWRALVAEGVLEYTGQGFYAIATELREGRRPDPY